MVHLLHCLYGVDAPGYEEYVKSQIYHLTDCMVLLRRKFMPRSGPEIAKVVEIYTPLVYLLGEKANHFP